MATSTPIFGVIPTGNSAIIAPTSAPSPTSFTYALPSSPFSHIVVFLLPGISLPTNTAASVYIAIINPAGAATPNDYKFLGGIGPGKESAIFKINNNGNGGFSNGAGNGGEVDMDMNGFGTAINGGKQIILGISVESADEVSSKMAALQTSNNSSPTDPSTALVLTNKRSTPISTVVLAQRIIKNAFNFLASFAGNVPIPGGSGTAGVEVVPLKSFQDWWTKFENKIKNDPGFLERDVD